MNLSFYSGSVGAAAQQTKLDVVANNITNVNTYGYKAKRVTFLDLLYNNIRDPQRTPVKQRQGCGARTEKTDPLFTQGAFHETGAKFDFMIEGEGFFAIEKQNEIYFTRDGSFSLSQQEDGQFYLVLGRDEFVLDSEGNRIIIDAAYVDEDDFYYDFDEEEEGGDMPDIGIFDFAIKDGMICVEGNKYTPVPKNGDPFLSENARLVRGNLEAANVNLADEMSDMIKAQRSYQLNLRMVQTSDEIESTINNLRS